MRFAYLGNQKASWCTEVHITKTLQSMGHSVVFIQEDETSRERVAQTVKQSGAELFLWTHTWSWGDFDLESLKSLPCPSVFLHLDLVRSIPDRESKVESAPQYRCNYVFMPDGDPESIVWFRGKGINYFYSPPAVFGPACYLAEADPALSQEVIFVGASYEHYHPQWLHRRDLLNHLREQYGSRFTLYEHSSQKREHALNVLYASCKVAVGDTFSPGYNRKLYFSDRLFECAGRGCPQVFPRIPGIERYFVEGKEILLYDFGNWDELDSKIEYLLTHEDEREEMRVAAWMRVLKEHTYKTRLENVLDVVLHGRPNKYETVGLESGLW